MVIIWFHHQVTPCLIVTSVLVNSIIIMDYLAMYFHPLGDLYLWKLCSHFYLRFERLSKKIHMNINSRLYSSFHMGCIFFFYINMSIPCKKCLYHVIIVKPKVVPWYNDYDSWVFVLIKNQIGIHLQAMDVTWSFDKISCKI